MRNTLLLKLNIHPSPLWVIFEVNFLRNLSIAMLNAILPLYFFQFMHSTSGVGFIYFIGYGVATITNIYAASIIKHLKKRRVLILALLGISVTFALFTLVNHSTTLLFLFAFYEFVVSLFIIDISLYIKHYSNYREIAENTGKMGSIGNIGWLVGPLLGALLANQFGFEAVFLFAAGTTCLALISFFFVRLAHEETVVMHQLSFRESIGKLFRKVNLRRTYINNAGLGFIFSLWDYLPLLMTSIGATITTIGMTKTLMGVAQSIFEYPIGQLADRQTGERRLFIGGYLLISAFTLILGFTTSLPFFITFFFIAAIGSSCIEMTRDAYFFRQVPEGEVELIGVYRTSDTVPLLIGQGMGTVFLLFGSLQLWFILGGALAFFFGFNAYRLNELRR